MPKDLYNDVKVTRVISPISPAATGTITGQVVDTSAYRSTTFVIAAGAQTTTGITVIPTVKSGSATGSLTAVADANLLGTEAAAALSGTAGANDQSKIGYTGSDRYASCDLLVTAAATGVYSVVCIQSGAIKGPVS